MPLLRFVREHIQRSRLIKSDGRQRNEAVGRVMCSADQFRYAEGIKLQITVETLAG